MSACHFPTCPSPATTENKRGQDMCSLHSVVIVGDYVVDAHDASEGVDG